jgi:hypothetical protein
LGAPELTCGLAAQPPPPTSPCAAAVRAGRRPASLPPRPARRRRPVQSPLDAAFADHPSAEIRVPSLDVGPLARAYDEIKNLGSKVL